MRCILLTAFGFMLALAVVPLEAYATGNVLLPPANMKGDAPLPSLGISVPDSSSSMNGPAASPASPSPSSPTEVSKAAASPPITQQQSSSAMTGTAAAMTPAVSAPDMITHLSPSQAAKLPKGSMPTTIIQQPDMSASIAEAGMDLPSSLVIAIGNNSIFGAKDVQIISQKLGLTRDQITTNCYLTARGYLQTDKGGYILNGGTSPQFTVRYDGMIKNYMLAGTALCLSTNPPSGSGFLTETDGRFTVSLQPIKCAAPTRQVSSLTITYDGSRTSQCVYQ